MNRLFHKKREPWDEAERRALSRTEDLSENDRFFSEPLLKAGSFALMYLCGEAFAYREQIFAARDDVVDVLLNLFATRMRCRFLRLMYNRGMDTSDIRLWVQVAERVCAACNVEIDADFHETHMALDRQWTAELSGTPAAFSLESTIVAAMVFAALEHRSAPALRAADFPIEPPTTRELLARVPFPDEYVVTDFPHLLGASDSLAAASHALAEALSAARR